MILINTVSATSKTAVSNFSYAQISSYLSSWDVVGILALGIGAVVAGFFLGKNKLNLILICSYFSYAIFKIIPWGQLPYLNLKTAPSPSVQVFLFLAIIALLFILLPHSFFALSSRRSRSSWWRVSIFSILVFGFIASVVFSFLPVKVVKDLGPLTQRIFVGQLMQFVWLILPIIGAIILRRDKKGDYSSQY